MENQRLVEVLEYLAVAIGAIVIPLWLSDELSMPLWVSVADLYFR